MTEPVRSVWTRPPRGGRDLPVLSRSQIVTAALELLDTEGMAALSMRKLGARLNAGATSLYSHLANKDELIELVVDEVYGEIEIPDGAGEDWRGEVRLCAHSLRAAILRHPWIVSVLGEVGVAYLGPNMMRMSESMLALFERAGFSLEQADQAVTTLVAYVSGLAVSEAAWLSMLNRSGMAEQEWKDSLWPAAEQAVKPHSRLRRLYAAQRSDDSATAREDSFAAGLECFLDGLAQRRQAQ